MVPPIHTVDRLGELSTAALVYTTRVNPYVGEAVLESLFARPLDFVVTCQLVGIFADDIVKRDLLSRPGVGKNCISWYLRAAKRLEPQISCVEEIHVLVPGAYDSDLSQPYTMKRLI